MATTTHRHVFFADSDVPEAEAEWTCTCGHAVVRAEGDPEESFIVISRPRQPEFTALEDGDPLLERLLEGLEATPVAGSRRSA
jgi:hypothetical protein